MNKAKVFLSIILLLSLFLADAVWAANTQLQIKILSFCGNNVREESEQCDDPDLGSNTCVSRGYASGVLSCNANCSFNIAACVARTIISGGGGGGGSAVSEPAPTTVVFVGRAYPMSKVGVLKDGQLAITTIAGPDANFNITLGGLSAGNYNFAVYGEDNVGRRSSLFTFPITITAGATTQVSGIFIAPTIAVDKSEVKRGDNIAIFGQAVPRSEVSIQVNSSEPFFNKVKADNNGVYLYNFDTEPLEIGDHTAKSKAAVVNEISSFSQVIGFAVGDKNKAIETKSSVLIGDINKDGRVNLVDFSILAYWYKRPKPTAIVDLSHDGKVDLVDLSIMAFNWTG